MSDALITLGKFGAAYGVRGWIHLYSYTAPSHQLFHYPELLLLSKQTPTALHISQHRPHQDHFVVQCEGIHDRNHAQSLTNQLIGVQADQLPPLDAQEYYWHELIGCEVLTTSGALLGRVDHLLETGANDVLVVYGEKTRMIPYHDQYIHDIQIAKQQIIVEWDPDF